MVIFFVQLPISNVANLVTLERGSCTKRYWSYFLCSYLSPTWPSWLRWREVAAQKIWPVPEAVVTVLCTPDDGCGWHPKHVEWTYRIINTLLCVKSPWQIINIHFSIILPSTPRFSKCSYTTFSHRNPVCISSVLIRATCPAQLIHLDLVTRIIFGEKYRS